MKAAILCAQGLEECEALIVYDLLYRAGIETKLVGFDKEITSSHQLSFTCTELLKDFDGKDVDCLILPGGIPGTPNLEKEEKVQELIDFFVKENRILAAICAAPSILLHKGLLKNDQFTCFPGHEGEYRSTGNKVEVDGNFITARGLGAAFEFAYAIIEKLDSKQKADEIFRRIQY